LEREIWKKGKKRVAVIRHSCTQTNAGVCFGSSVVLSLQHHHLCEKWKREEVLRDGEEEEEKEEENLHNGVPFVDESVVVYVVFVTGPFCRRL